MDKGVIERREHLSLKDFQAFYDGKKPVRFLFLLLIFTSCYIVSSQSHKTSVPMAHHQVVLNM
jgi:hypothetical protein